MKQATLCLLIKEDNILLAMKKRGFGVGRWNGVGGKVKDGEEIVDAMMREVKEEIGVDIIKAEKFGVFHFSFPHKPEFDQDVHLFVAKKWGGEPTESEEMMPKWFSFNEIPYDKMWADDKHWLGRVLKGEKLEADFVFKQGEIIDKHSIKKIN